MLNFKPAIDYPALTAHELANVFPMIGGQELEELKADIARNGIRVPITLFDDGSGRSHGRLAVGESGRERQQGLVKPIVWRRCRELVRRRRR